MKIKFVLIIFLIVFLLILLMGAGLFDITGKVTKDCMDNYVDLGTEDEKCHALEGWNDTHSGRRLMNLRENQSLDLWIESLNKEYELSFKHYDGLCDDSFEVYINGEEIFPFVHYEGGNLTEKIKIKPHLINSSKVKIIFKNKASDNCGYSGIDWVKISLVE